MRANPRQIWTVRRRGGGEDDAGGEDKVLGGDDDELKVECMQTLEHPSEVWRVEWNVTGTTLATTCEDEFVRMFSLNAKGVWEATVVDVN